MQSQQAPSFIKTKASQELNVIDESPAGRFKRVAMEAEKIQDEMQIVMMGMSLSFGENVAKITSKAIEENDTLPIVEIAKMQKRLENTKKTLATITKQINKELDASRKYALPEALEQHGLEGGKVKGLGTISLRSDLYVSKKVETSPDDLAAWLIDHEYDEIVNTSVSPSGLKKLCKEINHDDLEKMLNITPYDYTVITK